jgi:hypothetical protein
MRHISGEHVSLGGVGRDDYSRRDGSVRIKSGCLFLGPLKLINDLCADLTRYSNLCPAALH